MSDSTGMGPSLRKASVLVTDPSTPEVKDTKPTVKVWKKSGTKRCARCDEAALRTEYILVEPMSTEACAQITHFLTDDHKKFYSPFRVLKVFEGNDEARRYAEENNCYYDRGEVDGV